MNDLKFRAFDKKTKKMFAVHELNFQENNGMIGAPTLIRGYNSAGCTSFEGKDVFGSHNVKRFELMQFTGLKDKNGVDIYEGDIVLVKYCDECRNTESEKVAVTLSSNGTGYSPFNWVYSCDGCDCSCNIVSLEVIGNIYENPELLKS